jgi:hypothetical protein
MMTYKRLATSLLLTATLLLTGAADAARQSNIKVTKHNLSSSGTGTTHSTTESQICVFCHTPHGSDTTQATPLWNKTLQNTTYTPYSSSSLDAAAIQGASAGQPLGSSKLCLSCHDGVMALGSVRVLRGQLNTNTGTGGNTAGSGSVIIGGGTNVTMPAGSGASTGYTRLLGSDLTNDHPISVTYDDALSDRDGELRRPTMTIGNKGQTLNRWGTVVGVRAQGDSYKPLLPLANTGSNNAGQVQCTTCHDPHINETNLTAERNIKFLRANRFQKAQPADTFSASNDIICLSCHDKGMQGIGATDTTWAYSVHANSQVATQTYKTSAADTREFPSTTSGAASNIQVWQAACLNCHDTHTVSGARRLLREGTDANPVTALNLGGFKAGGAAALEETCYQCHNTTTNSILNDGGAGHRPPDIKTEFNRTYRMRIRSADQPAGGTETHDIGGNFTDTYNNCTTVTNKCGADLIESRSQLGNGNANNRHVECSDCHNPHRIVKFQRFDGSGGSITGAADTVATHKHLTNSSVVHDNIASGVLRGSWGVEPIYTSNDASFQLPASDFTVRRGDPGNDTVVYDNTQSHPADAKTYVTREYQVCLKCHSSFGYGSSPPNLDATNAKGLTATATNGTTPTATSNLVQYTDQAKEFQAPSTHKKDVNLAGGQTTDSGANATYKTNNHRSWHPVLGSTGRTATERGGLSATNWNHPFQNIGTQTMYCSDCHGSAVSSSTSVVPDDATNAVWGPHGSAYPFILKGLWNKDKKSTDSDLLCFKCHKQSTYSGSTEARTGFQTDKGDGHKVHRDRINCCGGSNQFRCSYCHVAVPHGWKNKALLVNLNDVGAEGGLASGTEVRKGTTTAYNNAPYYMNAYLKVLNFKKSGAWTDADCGSKSLGSNSSGRAWMKDSTENCKTPP